MKIVVYPNPSDNFIKIESPKEIKNMAVFNSNGQLIENTEINMSTKTVDFSKVANGIYLIKIVTTSNTFNQKVIINNH